MVKKKAGELRFCCDFRPLNEVTIKDAYPLPRIDESLFSLGNARVFTSIDLAWAFWQIPVKNHTGTKLPLHVNSVYLNGAECHLAYAMHLQRSNEQFLKNVKDKAPSRKHGHGLHR